MQPKNKVKSMFGTGKGTGWKKEYRMGYDIADKTNLQTKFESVAKEIRAHFRKYKVTKKVLEDAIRWSRGQPPNGYNKNS